MSASTRPNEIHGRIRKVIRRIEQQSGQVWAVVQFEMAEDRVEIAEGLFAVGDLEAGALTMKGTWREDRRGALRFTAAHVWRGALAGWAEAPPTEGLVRFLAEGGLQGVVRGYGIGPARASALGEVLGKDLWAALTGNVTLLAPHVRGAENAAALQAAIGEIGFTRVNALSRILVLNLSLKKAERALDVLGLGAIDLIRSDPYVLAQVPGIAFRTADEVAVGRLGIDPLDPRRLRAMVRSVLVHASNNGSTSLPREDVLAAIAAELRSGAAIDRDPEDVLAYAVDTGAVMEDMGDVYLPWHLGNEKKLARGAALLASSPRIRLPISPGMAEALDGLTDEQVQAVMNAITSRISVITGPPGSGKTHVVRAIKSIAGLLQIPITLTASTGRAAERVDEILGATDGSRAVTTHSVIGSYAKPKELPEGSVLVDEGSMLDLDASARLIDGAANSQGATSVVLIGDEEQLESVMPGAVFRDLGKSGVVPMTRLTRVFRQEQNSLISVNRERIRRGQMPLFHDADLGAGQMREINTYFAGEPLRADEIVRNVYHVHPGDPERGAERVVASVLRWVEKGRRPEEIMVISPQIKGKMGTRSLNEKLQAVLNPAGEPIDLGAGGVVRDANGIVIRIGDPISQTRNEDKKSRIINGTRGVVRGVDEEGKVRIDWGERRGERSYPRSDVRAMRLGYCDTIHKAQGGEVPIVILALHESEHYINLKRSLLLVAATRAVEAMVYVATPRAIAMAVRSEEERRTRLRERTRIEYEQIRDRSAVEDGEAGSPVNAAEDQWPRRRVVR